VIPAFALPTVVIVRQRSAVWPPDDRLQRTIQYAVGPRFYR